MKVSIDMASSLILLLSWLCDTELADAFSVVRQSFAASKSMRTASSVATSRVDTRIFMGPELLPKDQGEELGTETQAYSRIQDQGVEGVKLETLSCVEDENEELKHTPVVKREPLNPQSVVSKSFNDFLKSMANKQAAFIMAVAIMASAVFNPLPAMAAQSGGRMGGSFPAQRISPPPVTRMAPSRSYGSGFSSGFASGYIFPRPPSVYLPTPAPVFLNPFARPSYYYSSPGVVVQSRTPNLLGNILLVGAFGVLASTVLSSFSGTATVPTGSFGSVASSALGSGVSVAELSVAIEVPRRDDPNSILSFLDRISRTARTDSRVGVQNLTSQVALELLRRKSSIVSASTNSKHFNDRDRAQREFNNIAIKERGKFEHETVSRYGGVDYSPERSGSKVGASSGQATMAVVTMVVAIEGDSTKLPRIRSMQDVEEALRRIASDSKVDDCLQSAEILWTPEERSETLTQRDVVADYPGLRSI